MPPSKPTKVGVAPPAAAAVSRAVPGSLLRLFAALADALSIPDPEAFHAGKLAG